MKGDKIKVITPEGESEILAASNGSSVSWSSDREWITLEQVSKANKVVRTMKFKKDNVLAVIEEPKKPV